MPAAGSSKTFEAYFMTETENPVMASLLIFLLRTFRTDLSKTRKILGFHLSRRFVFASDRVVNFFSMNGDFLRGIDAQADFIASSMARNI